MGETPAREAKRLRDYCISTLVSTCSCCQAADLQGRSSCLRQSTPRDLRSYKGALRLITTTGKFRFSTWKKKKCFRAPESALPSQPLPRAGSVGSAVVPGPALPSPPGFPGLLRALLWSMSRSQIMSGECPEQFPAEIRSKAGLGWSCPQQHGQGTSLNCHFQDMEGSCYFSCRRMHSPAFSLALHLFDF